MDQFLLTAAERLCKVRPPTYFERHPGLVEGPLNLYAEIEFDNRIFKNLQPWFWFFHPSMTTDKAYEAAAAALFNGSRGRYNLRPDDIVLLWGSEVIPRGGVMLGDYGPDNFGCVFVVQRSILLYAAGSKSSSSSSHEEDPSSSAQPRRALNYVYTNGSFDTDYYGHANQLRRAKQMADYLVVGVHSDIEIVARRGPPVFTEQERCRMVRGIKWVDKVVENALYVTSVEILDEYGCDYYVHGDDTTLTADGHDPYQNVKCVDRFKECKRTVGISTTDLVGRMLLMTKNHHIVGAEFSPEQIRAFKEMSQNNTADGPGTRLTQYLPTVDQSLQFAEGRQAEPNDRVIYVAGAFDLFHIGHLSFLEEAAKHGTYVIVGVHTDQVVNRYEGKNRPIMSMHERVLSVLACRHVNEVVIGAPYSVTAELMDHFGVNVVLHGQTPFATDLDEPDPYAEPKRRGKFEVIDSQNDMTTAKIVEKFVGLNVECFGGMSLEEVEKPADEQLLNHLEDGFTTSAASTSG